MTFSRNKKTAALCLFVSFIAIALFSIHLAGCIFLPGGGDDDNPVGPLVTGGVIASSTQTVGNQGAVITLDDGTSVTIPQGALTADTPITVTTSEISGNNAISKKVSISNLHLVTNGEVQLPLNSSVGSLDKLLLFVGNDQNPGMTRRGIKLGSDNKSLIIDLASLPIQLTDQNPSIRGFASIRSAAGESGTDFLVTHSETQYTWNHDPFEITYDTSEHVNLDDAKLIGTQLEQARNLAENELGLRLPPELSKGNTIEVFVKPLKKGTLGDAPVVNFPGYGNNIRLNSDGAKAPRQDDSAFKRVLDSDVAAHEYFHLVQQSYSTYGVAKLNSWVWLFEASAVYFQYLNLGGNTPVNLWEGDFPWLSRRPQPEHLLKGFVETGALKDANGNRLSDIDYTRGHFLNFLATEQKRSSAVLKQFLDAMKEGAFKGFYSGITSITPSMNFVEEYENYLLYYLKNFDVAWGGELVGGEKQTFAVSPVAGKLVIFQLRNGTLAFKEVHDQARITVFGGKGSESIKDSDKREKLADWKTISGSDYPYIFVLAFNKSTTDTHDLCKLEFTADGTTPTTPTAPTTKTLDTITISKTTIEVKTGAEFDLGTIGVTGNYTEGTTKTTAPITSGISWSGDRVAGTTFKAGPTEGTVKLICTVDGKTAELTVTVSQTAIVKTLTGIVLKPIAIEVEAGKTYDLTQIAVTAHYAPDSSTAPVTTGVWTVPSGGGSISGMTYTAPSTAGDVVLTCTFTDGTVTKTADLTVTVTGTASTKTLTGLELTPLTTSVTTGGTYDLTQVVVKAMYENDPSVTVTNVTWGQAERQRHGERDDLYGAGGSRNGCFDLCLHGRNRYQDRRFHGNHYGDYDPERRNDNR